MKHTAKQVLRRIGLGDRFTLEELTEHVERHHQRPLRIVEVDEVGQGDGFCAVVLRLETDDVVLHIRSESDLHQEQFILHELAHLLLGHLTEDTNVEFEVAEQLLPDIPRSAVVRMLKRHRLDRDIEHEAETFADHLAACLRRSGGTPTRWSEVFG
jgi:Zn-dependent peptidase ImmA (M78 family)